MTGYDRYQVIRESDGRGVVIDALKHNMWVFGPASITACRKYATRMNQGERSMSQRIPDPEQK